jgi:hypothetical protein
VLLGILFVDYTSVVNYASNGSACVLVNLPGTCWCQVVPWWPLIRTLRPLIAISLLSAISCEVTRLSTKETCEDFPLSILLGGSSGVSSFSAASYALFISISSWEEIFGFCYPSSCSSRRGVHGCLILPEWIIMPRFVYRWWPWSCLEPVCSVLHVCIELLLFDRSLSPVFIGLWFWPPHDMGVHCIG